MKEPGVWYDWSTHATAPGRTKPGGGVIELVRAVHAHRGQSMKLNEAASWLVERGHSFTQGSVEVPAPPPSQLDPANSKVGRNAPIRRDLVPSLSRHGEHPVFVERGIGAETCHYLRCGYLDHTRGRLAKRIVFQIGGVSDDGRERVILSHMGRATTDEQGRIAKWMFFKNFNTSLELYNLDNLLLDETASRHATTMGLIVVTEGAFDVAKLIEAGFKNVVATFGSHLTENQADKLARAATHLSVPRILLFFDRDRAGREAAVRATVLLESLGLTVMSFNWEQTIQTKGRGGISIPETIRDPCDMTVEQIRWMLRAHGRKDAE